MTATVFNKETALECLAVAKRALASGDREKAQRFALKAKKLCECHEVLEFLLILNGNDDNQNHNRHKKSPETDHSKKAESSTAPNLKHRSGSVPNSSSPQHSSHNLGTPEQRNLINQIRNSKNYYETLGIEKGASDEDVKKAYKKLALKLHPDKNRAAGAEEAFKAVSRAFCCLSDTHKRANYDSYGSEDGPTRLTSRRHEYSEEIDPHEIFNMFFNGAFAHPGVRMYNANFGPRYRQSHSSSSSQQNQNANMWQLIMSLLPLLLFIYISMLSVGEEAPYKLSNDYGYKDLMHTAKRKIPYYVKSRAKFQRQYPEGGQERIYLESEAEKKFRDILLSMCQQEKMEKHRLQFWSARDADKYVMRHCDLYNQYFVASDSNIPTTVK